MLQDIYNYYMYLCTCSKEDLKDYEEKLLEKCFDNSNDHFVLGRTDVCYEPPFLHSHT